MSDDERIEAVADDLTTKMQKLKSELAKLIYGAEGRELSTSEELEADEITDRIRKLKKILNTLK